MRDIVDRLREAHPNSAQRFAGSNILLDAADEIERLRKALEPFANSDMRFAYETGHVESLDSCVAGVCDFTVGDLLDARAALDAVKEG